MVDIDFQTKVLPVSKKLLRFATHFLRNEDDARDVVQDVFLKLWQKREELNKIDNIEAFTIKMTRNKCLDVLRSGKTVAFDADTSRQLKEVTVDVHSKIEHNEAAGQIKQLISQLPELQQKVIQLRDIEQMEYEEIAEVTGLQINAIRVNLSRARKKVRDEYLKMNADEDFGNKKFAPSVF